MKIKWLVYIFIIACLGMTGCSLNKTSLVKNEIGGMVHAVKESVEEYNMHKDVEVHTEDEMKSFALECLKEKYGMSFIIDDRYSRYKHMDGHDEKPMILRARAYPEGKESYICALYVEEPNIIKDNYSVQSYRQDIEKIIFPQMEQYGVKGRLLKIDYPLMTGTIGDNLSAEDILMDTKSCLCICQDVDKESDNSSYIPVIRKWLDYLYTCDYDWYFALTDRNDNDYQYFGLSKGDYGYTSTDEWTDENILDEIDTCMSMN